MLQGESGDETVGRLPLRRGHGSAERRDTDDAESPIDDGVPRAEAHLDGATPVGACVGWRGLCGTRAASATVAMLPILRSWTRRPRSLAPPQGWLAICGALRATGGRGCVLRHIMWLVMLRRIGDDMV